MGYNDFHLSLIAPGWVPSVTVDLTSKTADGDFVNIAHVEKDPKGDQPSIQYKRLEKWLLDSGYTNVTIRRDFPSFADNDIKILLGVEGAYVSEVILTFWLGDDPRSRVRFWQEFVERLCKEWNLKLAKDGQVTEVGDFVELLEKSFAWECFLNRPSGPKQ